MELHQIDFLWRYASDRDPTTRAAPDFDGPSASRSVASVIQGAATRRTPAFGQRLALGAKAEACSL